MTDSDMHVKRYFPSKGALMMVWCERDNHAPYVKYSDYQQLERKLAASQKEVSRLEGELAKSHKLVGKLQHYITSGMEPA